MELDPLSPVINGTLGVSLVMARRYDEGRAQIERALATGGDQAFGHSELFLWGPQMGLTGEEMADHAVSFARAMRARDPEVARVIGHALASDGADDALRSAARDAFATLIADSVFTVWQIAALYTGLGDHEAALQWLENSAAEGDLSLSIVGFDPSLDPLRDDPRMQRLTDELGLPNGYDPAADTYEPEGAE